MIIQTVFQSRDDKIRTCGLFVPNEARYRAALHPEPFCAAKLHIFLIWCAKCFSVFSFRSKTDDTQMLQQNLQTNEYQDDTTNNTR